jgi:glyoxylate reductase
MPPSPEVLRERVADAEGLLCLLTERVDAGLLDACPRLEVVSNYAVGTDNVDLDEATRRGIPVGNTPDVLTDATADLAWALLMAGARRLGEAERFVRGGHWSEWTPDGFLGVDVHGACLGVVGWGRIGRAFAARASGFGMDVLHHSRSSGIPLDELLERADFVSLHAPLTGDTRGMIGARELELMKPTAILINTARGELVDTTALTEALHMAQIGGAALDVTDPEPLPGEHPLLAAPNVIVVPHIGSATRRTRAGMGEMASDNLIAALAGERMPHPANPDVY